MPRHNKVFMFIFQLWFMTFNSANISFLFYSEFLYKDTRVFDYHLLHSYIYKLRFVSSRKVINYISQALKNGVLHRQEVSLLV